MDRQTLRGRARRYDAEGLRGLRDRPRSGRKPRLAPGQGAELATVVDRGSDPDRDGVVRWRRVDPKASIEACSGVALHERSVGELLRRLGFTRLSVRPQHPLSGPEARVGRQGTPTLIRARRGSRPRAPRDRRYAWACLSGAVCPECAVGAGLVLPCANTEATGLHPAEISREVTPGAHAVVVLDGAGWDSTQLRQRACLARLRRHRRDLLHRLECPHAGAGPDRLHHPPRLGESGRESGPLV